MRKKMNIYLDFIRHEYRQGKENVDVSLDEILKVLFKWGSEEYKTLSIEEKIVVLKELLNDSNESLIGLSMIYLERFLDDPDNFHDEQNYFYQSNLEYLEYCLKNGIPTL